jgi:hypothetical protein
MDPARGLTGYTAPRKPNGHFRLTTHGSPPTSRLGGFLLRMAWLENGWIYKVNGKTFLFILPIILECYSRR